MADFGLTGQGFKRKHYTDIIADLETKAVGLFGDDVNVTVRSPLGMFIRVIAWALAVVWQVAEAVYHSPFVSSATGYDLDKVAQYIGITRREATFATGTVTFTGAEGAGIDAGTMVETEDGIRFWVDGNYEIGAGETTVDATIQAVTAGTRHNVGAGTITVIVEPIADIASVTNAAPTDGGQEMETDSEFRARYLVSLARAGRATLPSIRAALLDIPEVRAALVVENNTMEWDPGPEPDGRPPKSIECYVLGGSDADIAHTILHSKAAGIEPYGGDGPVVVEDDAGQAHDMYFTRATVLDIYVNVTVTGDDTYPGDGDVRITTEIIRYIGGTDDDGAEYRGLGMGEDVIYTRIIEACYQVPGVQDVVVTLNEGAAPDPGMTDNIAVALMEIAETDHTMVVVS